MRRARALGTIGLGAGLAALLPRMRQDFDACGAFRTSTAMAMWSAYGLGAALYAAAVRDGEPTASARRAAAATAVAAGAGLTAAGMAAFDSASTLAGTEAGELKRDGIYRLSRNPQYTGLVIAGLGGALARRSAFAAALAAGYGVVCAWWVRVEERALEREYGAEYDTFRATTPRWLGVPSNGS